MGSCENSVIVEEPVPVPISGQCLCSDFSLQSISELQSFSELPHMVIESGADLAGVDGNHMGDGEGLKEERQEGDDGVKNLIVDPELLLEDIHTVSFAGDFLIEHNSVESLTGNCELPLDAMLEADLGSSNCLSKNQSDIDAFKAETTGKGLRENSSEGDDCIVEEVIPVVNGNCLNVANSMERTGEFLQEGDNGLLSEEIPVTGLASGCCLNENKSEDDAENLTRNCELPLEAMPVADLAIAVCLSKSQSDVDSYNEERSEKCSRESGSEGDDGIVNAIEGSDSTREVIPVVNVNCLNVVYSTERTEECLQEGEICLPSEEITEASLASGCSLNENNSDVDPCKLEGSVFQAEGDVEKSTGNFVLPGEGCLKVDQSDHDSSGKERAEKCLKESGSEGEDDVSSLILEGEFVPKVTFMPCLANEDCLNGMEDALIIDLPANSVHDETEQKDDKSFERLRDEIEEVLEGEGEALVLNSDLSQESPLKSYEVAELVDDVHEQKEDNKSVGGSCFENVSGASGESEADLCKIVIPIQPCEVKLEASSTACLSSETISEAVGVETSIETLDQDLLPLRSETAYKFESPISCVIEESEQNERSVHTSTQEGIELLAEKNDISDDTKVEVGSLESSDHIPVSLQSSQDNQGKYMNGVISVSEANCDEVASSSAQKKGRKSRPKRNTQLRNGARQCKRTAKASSSHKSFDIVFKVTKKRSIRPKVVRSSAWGLLGNVTQLFERTNELQPLQVSEKGPQKPKGRNSNGTTKNKNGTTTTAQGSKKSRASNASLRLKVKVGKGANQSSVTVKVPDLVNADVEGNAFVEKPAEESRDELFGISKIVIDASGGATGLTCKDPGTSPDSEVINLVPDSHTDSKPHDDFHHTVIYYEDLCSNTRGKKKNKLSGSGCSEERPSPGKTSRANPLKQYGRKQNGKNDVTSSEKEPFVAGPSVSDEKTDGEAYHLDSDLKSKNSKKSKTPAQKSPKGKAQGSDSGIKMDKQMPAGKSKINETHNGDLACDGGNQPYAENNMVDNGTITTDNIASTIIPKLDLLPGALGEKYVPSRNAWVRCDECHKWRRILAELADQIEESKCTWTCMDNVDKLFASCTTPQEKSNSDINAELDISDGSGDEDASGTRQTSKGLECKRPIDLREAITCTTIRTNQFLHRNRKTQNIDEIMVCHCKPHSEGRLGCRDDCLNRILNIECSHVACPCGELCSNQQFQKRKYAKLGKFRCGKKGYGLKLLEDVPKGKFLIEYVGEVLDMHAYEARQKEYALKGHKHFYFMTLNGSEVIDACVKGNKGRYINHSCEPNCQTEKWMVNGEICIGLFALKDMKKGDEVTFDYNYVRVFGAAAKKCYCLSPQCRGYIGGDPLNGDVIIQSDSDEDLPEPMTVRQNGRLKERNNIMKQTQESVLDDRDEKLKLPVIPKQPVSPAHDDAVEPSLKETATPVLPLETSQETEDSTSELLESSMAEETPAEEELSKSVSSVNDKKLSSKTHAKVKTSKKAKVKISPPSLSRVHLPAIKKPQRVMEGSFGSHFEAVEEKLNELLDPDGGISKRKDAARGYLKLLLLTSCGTTNTIQRNRDLSMILDALLKTRSRVVLLDIINKNGLRMLHKLINQYRRDFQKTPIVRKLLKVLEYLANREILTLEHIKEAPPHKGMESFRESFLSLTEHENKQVHQIARNFRDRWIPKYLRRHYADRDDNKPEFSRNSNYNRFSPTRSIESDCLRRSSESTDCVKQSAPSTPDVSAPNGSASQTGVTRTRKRKSRWDQPAETYFQDKEPKTEPNIGRKEKVSRWDQIAPDKADEDTDLVDDAPPGFSCPIKPPSALPRDNTVVGHPQEKFLSRLPVSYGIPISIVQQCGTLHEGISGSWVIAPGMPFLPFPPLPPFPRDRKETPPLSVEECEPSTAGDQPAVPIPATVDQCPVKRGRESSLSNDLGTKYYKQQKWNSTKLRPPWHWTRKSWGVTKTETKSETNDTN